MKPRRCLPTLDTTSGSAAISTPSRSIDCEHYPEFVSRKSERRRAREVVTGYHEAQLAELVARVAEAVDRFRDGELNAFEIDRVLFPYSRAAKELWKFCNDSDVEFTARVIVDRAPADWWQRGAPSRR